MGPPVATTVRIAWSRVEAGDVPLALPPRRTWPAAIVFAIMFAVFGAVWLSEIAQLRVFDSHGAFDAFGFFFRAFWLFGWSVAVIILGAATVFVAVVRESARIDAGRLVQSLHIGPLRIVTERDLARMHNLRIEPAGGKTSGKRRVCFDYEGKPGAIGDAMPTTDAERLLAALRIAAPAGVTMPAPAPAAAPTVRPSAPPTPVAARPTMMSAPSVALIAANLVPLAGVLTGKLTLADVIVLFWAETALIGLIAIAKIIMVARWFALLAVPFFAGHFGCFMAVHFLFIYGFFLGGFAERAVAFAPLMAPLWPYLALLAGSHAMSFALNFIGRREYAGENMAALMTAPYRRVIIMHLTVIFGGMLAMTLGTPAPALALLIALKVAADLRAHWRERRT